MKRRVPILGIGNYEISSNHEFPTIVNSWTCHDNWFRKEIPEPEQGNWLKGDELMPNIRDDIRIVESTGEQKSYVVAGAILSCSKGDKPNRLKMPFSHGVYIQNKAQMNIKDHVPNENIFPFGKCCSMQNPTVASATAANNGVLTPMPCTPMTTMPWIMGKDDKLIEGQPALLNKSMLSCLYCGVIKIEDDGQLLEGAYAKEVYREIAGGVSARNTAMLKAAGAIPAEGTPKYRAVFTPPPPTSPPPEKDSWQEAVEGSVAALTGIMHAVTESGTYNMYQGETPSEYPKSYLTGKLVGNGVVTALGALETLGGGALFGGGVVADSTGAGAIVGVPANIAGAAAMAHGSTVATQGAANFGKDAKDLYNNIVGGSSGGAGNIEKTYKRPSGFRKGVRDKVWDNAKDANGEVKDPLTGNVLNKDEPWDMGHKSGYEFRKHQKSAQERGITRKEFLDEHNNPDHYRPESPSANRSHKGEDMTDDYFGP